LPTSANKSNETFVPVPYFSDFLVVHQYNNKASLQSTTYNPSNSSEEHHLSQKRESTFLNFERQISNLDSLNKIYPTRKSNRTNQWRGSQLTNEAKIGDFDLNHLFILNKCKLFCSYSLEIKQTQLNSIKHKVLISYGPHNIRQFYTNINTNFKSYIKTLHSRIPNRIVPLIWNDPVIQKLAKILSSASVRPKISVKKLEYSI
jgi:hypothetical protein